MSNKNNTIPILVFHGVIVASQSFRRHTIWRHYRHLYMAVFLLMIFSPASAQLVMKFNVTANGKPLVLNDSSYTNLHKETYQVSRLKYYVSGVELSGSHGDYFMKKDASLLDAGNSDSISINPAAGNYHTLKFYIGVDSLSNCSGAQAGALDPLNGMFWTWNTGYIFFKLEGYSPASGADLQRIEYHIGGYRNPNNVLLSSSVSLGLYQIIPGGIRIEKGKTYTVSINVNLDEYWRLIKISEMPLIMKPGYEAIKAAQTFSEMFSITGIE